MIISISGTPGTGKTTLANKLSKDLKLKYLDGNEIIKKHRIAQGFDKKRNCIIVDPEEFAKAALKDCKTNCIVDSHLSHFLPAEKVAACIICKTDLKTLKSRLQKRGYSKEKIQENLDSEIFEICLTQAKEKDHNIIIYNNNYKELLSKIKELQ